MSPQQITDIESLSSRLGPIGYDLGSELERTDQGVAAVPYEGATRVHAGRRTAKEGNRPRAVPAHSIGIVLSAGQFKCCLERERSLADRGTRLFSLLVLRRRSVERSENRGRDALAQFAREVSTRLRSTDLVGFLDGERVEILLTDTEPAGARVVAEWVEQIEATLGLDLDQTILVYPSMPEPGTHRDRRGDPPEGMPSNGCETDRMPRRGVDAVTARVVDMRAKGIESPGNWSMENLWPLLAVSTPRWKRSLDIAFAVLALLALSPLFLVIGIAIRLESPGPVIFRQWRGGRGARPFVFYKFRSMVVDAEILRATLAAKNEQDGPIFKIREDPRITRVGRLLRRWSLDELPQLWNVLKADISLVGPRSPTLDEVSKYERWHRRRLDITGGLTGPWQVSGRSEVAFRDWMRLDMRYVASRNVWLDLRLLLMTVPAVISGRGAY